MEVFNIYNIYIAFKDKTYTIYIYIYIFQKVFEWEPSDVLALVADVKCPDFSFLLLLYLHG